MEEMNPNVNQVVTNGHAILDGDKERILDIANTGNVNETDELFLTVPSRKLDGLCPPWASPFYPEMCSFHDRVLESVLEGTELGITEHFEGMYYHVRVEGFVLTILNSYREDGSCWKLS
jgi:hypothetical protein